MHYPIIILITATGIGEAMTELLPCLGLINFRDIAQFADVQSTFKLCDLKPEKECHVQRNVSMYAFTLQILKWLMQMINIRFAIPN